MSENLPEKDRPNQTRALTLAEKLHAIMSNIDRIKKDKRNTHQNYEYASEKAIKEALHDQFVENRVLFGLSTGNPQFINGHFFLDVVYKFIDVDDPTSTVEGTFLGSGQGRDEKGNYAAITGAIKYILTSNFLIPTGDDPEKDEKPYKKAAPPTQNDWRAKNAEAAKSDDLPPSFGANLTPANKLPSKKVAVAPVSKEDLLAMQNACDGEDIAYISNHKITSSPTHKGKTVKELFEEFPEWCQKALGPSRGKLNEIDALAMEAYNELYPIDI